MADPTTKLMTRDPMPGDAYSLEEIFANAPDLVGDLNIGDTVFVFKDGGFFATTVGNVGSAGDFSGSYDDLSDKPDLGTAAALNVGVAGGDIPQLDKDGKLPAVDASQLLNLPSGGLRYEPFFGDKSVLWSRPALGIGGDGATHFDTWLNQAGNPDDVAVGNYPSGADGPTGAGYATDGGSGYALNDTVTTTGGTVITIASLQLVGATIINAGSGGTPGPVVLGGPWSSSTMVRATVAGDGTLASIDSIICVEEIATNTEDTTSISFDPTDGNPLSGVLLDISFGAMKGYVTTAGALEDNPAAQASSSGSGTGSKWRLINNSRPATATDGANGAPLVLQMDSTGKTGSTISEICGLLKDLGAPPWRVTVGLAAPAQGDLQAYPFILYKSADHSAMAFYWVSMAGNVGRAAGGSFQQLGIDCYLDTTPGTNGPASIILSVLGGQSYFQWFRLEHDGTDIIFSSSYENVVYEEVLRRKAAGFLDSFDKIGFGAPRNWYGQTQSVLTVPLWNWIEG